MGVTIVTDGYGTHVLDEAGAQIASDCDGDLVVFARWLLAIREARIDKGSVAHIGGGLCCLLRMMGPGYLHRVFEIRPELRAFCPEDAPYDNTEFVIGDWKETLTQGSFDLIVYDLEGDIPREELSKFLTPGGLILPRV